MSYQDRLLEQINIKLDDLAEAGQRWIPLWVTHALCADHMVGLADDGEHREFWEYGTYMHVRRVVTQVINKRSDDNPHERRNFQLVLDGFERNRLQDYYVVTRDDEEIGVPIIGEFAITDDELDSKAALYRAMGQACFEHADELERFKEWRRRAA